MSGHLSGLVLDGLLAGGALDEEKRAHLHECDVCTNNLAQLEQEHRAVRELPEFVRTYNRLTHPSQAPAWWRPKGLWALAPALLATAGLALFVTPRASPSGVRSKGSAWVELVRQDGVDVVGAVHPGERVGLRLGGGRARYALVMGTDEHGEVFPVWPVEGEQSGLLPSRSDIPLAPAFEVTRGSLRLDAFFSSAPLRMKDVSAFLIRTLTDAQVRGVKPLEVALPLPPGAESHAQRMLQVESAR